MSAFLSLSSTTEFPIGHWWRQKFWPGEAVSNHEKNKAGKGFKASFNSLVMGGLSSEPSQTSVYLTSTQSPVLGLHLLS